MQVIWSFFKSQLLVSLMSSEMASVHAFSSSIHFTFLFPFYFFLWKKIWLVFEMLKGHPKCCWTYAAMSLQETLLLKVFPSGSNFLHLLCLRYHFILSNIFPLFAKAIDVFYAIYWALFVLVLYPVLTQCCRLSLVGLERGLLLSPVNIYMYRSSNIISSDLKLPTDYRFV